LLFLVPVLDRLGFGDWCELERRAVRAQLLTGRIFHALLSRLEVPLDDPAWTLAGAPEDDAQDRDPVASAFRRKISPADLWLTRCRRLLRRRVRIGLASLVMRPARIAVARTHADVFLRLNGADVRIRRAGLDIDPGWVPWFGRVVTFHYGDLPRSTGGPRQ
jgi:hypothetical protein